MTILLILIATLFVLFVVMLVTPFVVEVDTPTAQIGVRWGWIASIRLLLEEEPWRYRARVLFVPWHGELESFVGGQAGKDEGSDKKPVAQRWTKRSKPITPARRKWLLRAGWNALRAGRVRRFRWRYDPDDVVLAAWLFPLFQLWRIRGADVAVRFNGGSELTLVLAHSPLRVLWAMARTR